jgi:hypothetical protein
MTRKFTKWPQNIPNGHQIYQMTRKYTKWPQNLPNDHKIYQMTTKFTQWPQNLPNEYKIYQNNHNMYKHLPSHKSLPQFGFLVWKFVYHLATLSPLSSCQTSEVRNCHRRDVGLDHARIKIFTFFRRKKRAEQYVIKERIISRLISNF